MKGIPKKSEGMIIDYFVIMPGLFWKKRFSLTRKNDTKKLSNFSILLFLNDKIYSYTQKSNLALGNSAKLMFWSILKKFWKIQLVSLSLVRENLREMRVLFSQNPSLSQKKEIHFFKYNNFLNYYINFNLFHYIRSKAKSKAKKARICGPKGSKGT